MRICLVVVDVSDTTMAATGTDKKITAANSVNGKVTGQSSSVDSEIALFSGTGGIKTIKEATGRESPR